MEEAKPAQPPSAPLDMSEQVKKSWESSSDFANYFCTYGYIYHQKQMLSDELRMQCYHDSIFKNKSCFEGKVVLDVGTGSGILAIWAAQAGASKVYAVEATDMAHQARKIVESNGLGNVVSVIQSKIEDVNLPEKVDIIISEWMGYFLLRESMLDSVLYARDKWLVEGGAMYPSKATMYVSVIQNENSCEKRSNEYKCAMDDWSSFVEFTKSEYGVDMSCLTSSFRKEQQEYSLHTSEWQELEADELVAEPAVIKVIDINTCTLEDIKEVDSTFNLTMYQTARVGGFAGWFDVDFEGSPKNPADFPIKLCTSPFVQPTHWGQQVFPLVPTTQVCKGDSISGKIKVVRRKDNQRLMNVHFEYELTEAGEKTPSAKKSIGFQIQ